MAPLLGIISDSHGRAGTTQLAVDALRSRGAELILHLGDVETEAVLDVLVGIPARVVFGNCDDERGLARYAELVGVHVDHPAGIVECDGRRVGFTHGHLEREVNRLLVEGVDYLLHGHTHEVRDERIGSTRVINPGALFRASRYTAALLDPLSDTLEYLEIPRSP